MLAAGSCPSTQWSYSTWDALLWPCLQRHLSCSPSHSRRCRPRKRLKSQRLNLLPEFSLQIHWEFFHAQVHSCASHQHRCCGSGLFKYANHCRLHPSLLALAVVLNLRLTRKKDMLGYTELLPINEKHVELILHWVTFVDMCSFAWWAWSPPLKLQAKGGGGTPTLYSPCDAHIDTTCILWSWCLLST